jgi:hypothetical protein
MAIGFVQINGQITSANDGGASGTSVAPNWFSGATGSGHWLLAAIAYDVSSTVTPPSGWSEISGSPFSNASCFLRVYTIKNCGVRSGTETFTFGTQQTAAAALMIEYSGVGTTTDLDGTPNHNSSNSNSPTGSSYTTSVANDAVISIIAQGNASFTSGPVFSSPTGGSAIRGQTVTADISPNGNAGIALLDELGVAVGSYTFGASSNRSETWVVVTLAIRPAGASTPPLPPSVLTVTPWKYLDPFDYFP